MYIIKNDEKAKTIKNNNLNQIAKTTNHYLIKLGNLSFIN